MNGEASSDPLNPLRIQNDLHAWGGEFEYAETFEHPKLNAVLALWRERANGGIPFRADLDIRVLKDVVSHLWMLEEKSEDVGVRYRFRRVGTAVARVFGDMTGKYLDEAIPAPLFPRWAMACETFMHCGKVVRFRCKIDLPQANYLRVEAFHAPLLDTAGKPTILMAVSYFRPATDDRFLP